MHGVVLQCLSLSGLALVFRFLIAARRPFFCDGSACIFQYMRPKNVNELLRPEQDHSGLSLMCVADKERQNLTRMESRPKEKLFLMLDIGNK